MSPIKDPLVDANSLPEQRDDQFVAQQHSPKPAKTRIQRHGLLSRATANGLLLLTALYTLVPISWLVFSAMKSTPDLLTGRNFALRDFQLLTNLVDLFSRDDGRFTRWLLNTLFYAGGGALLGTLISVLAGYAFDKYMFRGREQLFKLVLAGVMVPSVALVVPLYLMLSQIGFANSYWGVLLVSVVNPFGVYLARIFCASSVPDEILEAARIDGAGELRIFFGISSKLMSTGVVTVFLLEFTSIWNNYFLPLVLLSDPDKFPVTLGLVSWNRMFSVDPEVVRYVVTGAFVTTVPLVLVFILLQRYWRAGITLGSGK